MAEMQDIDNLQVEYARANSLESFRKMVQKGAKNWYQSAVVAGASSIQIVNYLLYLFSNEKRSLLLAGYATVRYLDIFTPNVLSLETYLTEQYKEPEARIVFESIAIGAASTDNLELVEKCLAFGAQNKKAIALSAVATGAMRVLNKFVNFAPTEQALELATKHNAFAVLQYLLAKTNVDKIQFERIITVARESKHYELAEYLSSLQ